MCVLSAPDWSAVARHPADHPSPPVLQTSVPLRRPVTVTAAGCFVFLISSAPPAHLSRPVRVLRFVSLFSSRGAERELMRCDVLRVRARSASSQDPIEYVHTEWAPIDLHIYIFFFTCTSFSSQGFKLFHNIHPSRLTVRLFCRLYV